MIDLLRAVPFLVNSAIKGNIIAKRRKENANFSENGKYLRTSLRCHFCWWEAKVCEWKNCRSTKQILVLLQQKIPLNKIIEKMFQNKKHCKDNHILSWCLKLL